MERIGTLKKTSTVLGTLGLALGLVVTSSCTQQEEVTPSPKPVAAERLAPQQEGMPPQQQEPPKEQQKQEKEPVAELPPELLASCPILVEGTQVDVKDTEDGVAMDITTTQQPNVETLHERAQRLSQMYEQLAAGGQIEWHTVKPEQAKEGQEFPEAKSPFPKVEIESTNTERGTRLTFTPEDEQQLENLREHVRIHEQRLQAGQCFMIQQPQQ